MRIKIQQVGIYETLVSQLDRISRHNRQGSFHTKQCFPQYLQSPQKQVNPKPILFPQYSCTRSCKQVLKSYGYKATEIIRRAETDPNAPEGHSMLHKREEP